MNKRNKIFVLCPSHTKTGGTELLHQLTYQLNRLGIETYLAYTNYEGDGKAAFPDFQKYLVTSAIKEEDVQDNVNNLLILPEIYYKKAKKYKRLKIYIWWLSVDFFLQESSFFARKRIKGFKSALKNLLMGKLRNKCGYIKLADMHLCQSYYAMDFLARKGIGEDNIRYLSDYINDVYFENKSEMLKDKRENIVLYNPKKGYKFTKKLIDESPELNWVALKDMTNKQVQEIMRSSKVYVDFGNHPGKDRIPREAAISGCCIITGRQGAANYQQDVMIPDEFKFDEQKVEIQSIIQKINICIKNYPVEARKFEDYRELIKSEKEKFVNDLSYIFL